METQTQQFFSQQIGITDMAKFNHTLQRYQSLADSLSDLFSTLKILIPATNVKFLFDFVRDKHPERFITRRYGLTRAHEFPGQDVDELIKQKIMLVPPEFNRCIELQKTVQLDIFGVQETGFCYNMANLLASNGGKIVGSEFIIDDAFKIDLTDFCSAHTQNQAQNEFLSVLESIKQNLNTFAEMGVWNRKSYSGNTFGILGLFLELDKTGSEPLRIDRNALRKFKTPTKYKLRVSAREQFSIDSLFMLL